jgi:branched-chain amino acid transport system substrate-binding protein
VDGFFAQSRSERVKEFVAAFQLVYGRVPGIVEAVAYDSAMMVFQAMRQVASDSRRDLRQTLLQPDGFEGLSGRTTFAPNGDAQTRLQLLRVDQGRIVEVQQRLETPSVIEAQ